MAKGRVFDKKNFFYLVLSGGLVTSIFAYQTTLSSQQKAQKVMAEAPAREMQLDVSSLNKDNQFGTATLRESGAKVVVSVYLQNSLDKGQQPAHLHLGSCKKLGEIKYPLNSLVNGKSETVLNTSYDSLLSQKPLALNVHKSSSQMKVNVACADL